MKNETERNEEINFMLVTFSSDMEIFCSCCDNTVGLAMW